MPVPSLGRVGMSGDVLVHSSAVGHLCAYSHLLGVSADAFKSIFRLKQLLLSKEFEKQTKPSPTKCTIQSVHEEA